jgi:hypothetical protein
LTRAAAEPVSLDATVLDVAGGTPLLDHPGLTVRDGVVALPGTPGATGYVWRLS